MSCKSQIIRCDGCAEEFDAERATVSDFAARLTVAKDIGGRGKRWSILFDSKPFKPIGGYEHAYKTRREAENELADAASRLEYEQRMPTQDASGKIVWTADEETQISDYANKLHDDKPRLTLSGMQTLQESARRQQSSAAHTVWSWGARGEYGGFVCAEIRRACRARIEAFRRAGLVLEDIQPEVDRRQREYEESNRRWAERQQAEAEGTR